MKKTFLALLFVFAAVSLLVSCKEVSLSDTEVFVEIQEARADEIRSTLSTCSDATIGSVFFETEQVAI